MNLKDFKFPEVSVADAIFPTSKMNKELLEEAKKRGFYNGHTKYNELFSHLFFRGGRIEFKPDVDKEFAKRAWTYCRSFMGSWEPKHEEKEAICAMIMSEILLPELQSSEK